MNKISIHALTWSATNIKRNGDDRMAFQSTHSHGVRLPVIPIWLPLRKFQSTHSHGVRRIFTLATVNLLQFQSTHSHGVRLISNSKWNYRNYFNPRTHMECDIIKWGAINARSISIHALTWSATVNAESFNKWVSISIHALTWSATTIAGACMLFIDDFNPRTPCECDFINHRINSRSWNFNPRTHMECDDFIW